MAELLDENQIQDRLPEGWEQADDTIVCTYEFDDYLKGVAFASEVGELAEEEFHHPEIRIGYKEVEVRFTSHEEGGVTTKDIALAEECNVLR